MFKKQIFILTLSCYLLGCAGHQTGAEAGAAEPLPRGSDCILEGTVRDYRVLDDSNLVVTASAKRKYPIELSRRAFGLNSSWNLGFRSVTGRICPGTSEIIVDTSLGLDAFRIHSIRAISAEEYDDLLVHFGKKEPEVTVTPESDDVSGAEVEELD